MEEEPVEADEVVVEVAGPVELVMVDGEAVGLEVGVELEGEEVVVELDDENGGLSAGSLAGCGVGIGGDEKPPVVLLEDAVVVVEEELQKALAPAGPAPLGLPGVPGPPGRPGNGGKEGIFRTPGLPRKPASSLASAFESGYGI